MDLEQLELEKLLRLELEKDDIAHDEIETKDGIKKVASSSADPLSSDENDKKSNYEPSSEEKKESSSENTTEKLDMDDKGNKLEYLNDLEANLRESLAKVLKQKKELMTQEKKLKIKVKAPVSKDQNQEVSKEDEKLEEKEAPVVKSKK
jgi:hypothetical protein